MDDDQRRAAHLLLDSMIAYDPDAGDEANAQAIAAALRGIGTVPPGILAGAAIHLATYAVSQVAEATGDDLATVVARFRGFADEDPEGA